MTSVKTNENKNWTQLLKTNFSILETLFFGLKRFLHSKGPKNAICLWLILRNIEQSQICIVYFRSIFLVSATNKLRFQDLLSEGIFSGPKTKFLVMKTWSSEVVSNFCFCLFLWIPFYLGWIYKKRTMYKIIFSSVYSDAK